MKSLEDNIKSCTAIITDIRNFTNTFLVFQRVRNPEFYNFIEIYYQKTNEIVSVLTDERYLSSTGDGTITIFLDGDNHKNGYAYTLIIHKLLTDMCRDFNIKNKTNISFGIGADSGNVWKIGDGHLRTYVGTVINRAARIESNTKFFGNTKTSIGDSLYKNLLQEIDIDAYNEMIQYDNYDELISVKPATVLTSKKLLLQYIFDMELKGIEKNAPIFRLSESLFNDEKKYWRLLDQLISEDKVAEIQDILYG